MITSIEISTEGSPYVQLTIMPDDEEEEFFFITFRRYRRRVFVGVEYYGDVPQEDNPYIAPCYIIEKTVFTQFDPRTSFIRAVKFAGMWNELADADYWYERYAGIEKMVSKWQTTPLPY